MDENDRKNDHNDDFQLYTVLVFLSLAARVPTWRDRCGSTWRRHATSDDGLILFIRANAHAEIFAEAIHRCSPAAVDVEDGCKLRVVQAPLLHGTQLDQCFDHLC